MSLSLALALLVACEACDELATGAAAHPFAIGAAWRPKCDAASVRTVAADPWPVPGEIRRQAFTRDCADVVLTRAFVATDGGFTEGELFAGSLIEKKIGRGVTAIRQQEFLGRVGDFSYRYHATADGQRILASLERPLITSHLVSTVMASGPAVSGSAQSVTCEVWRKRCELVSRRINDNVALPFFTIVFDARQPDGDLCFDAPQDAAGGVTVTADAAVVIDGLKAPAGSYNACLGGKSAAALAAMGKARLVRYRVNRAPDDQVTRWDTAELDASGLAEAADLARFLLREAVGGARLEEGRKRAAQADALLAGSAIPN